LVLREAAMSVHFLELLDLLRRRSLRTASAVEDMLDEACTSAFSVDHTLAQRVIARDTEIDDEEVAIESEVIRLITLFQPVASDMRLLTTVLKVNSDLERIADCAVNIAQRAKHLDSAGLGASSPDLKAIAQGVQQMLRSALQAYAGEDADAARTLLEKDAAIDAFYGQFIRKLAAEATRSPELMSTHLDVLSIAKNLERIADHATNIAEDVIFLKTGQIVRHNRKR
jgi:phosphate transport system protein